MTPEQAVRIEQATRASADAIDRKIRAEGRSTWNEQDARDANRLKLEILATCHGA